MGIPPRFMPIAPPQPRSHFHELLAEAERRYSDLVAHNAALVIDRDRLRNIVEGLLGVLGKWIDADEIERWRAMVHEGAPR